MLRTVIAGVIGVVAGIVAAFLIVGVVCAVGGIQEPYHGIVDYGWEGARLGMLFFVFVGVVMVWPFPAIALAGAAVGLIVRLVLRHRATRAQASNA